MKKESVVVWFRQDLRMEDNPALIAGLKTGQSIIALYIYDNHSKSPWLPGGASRWWLHHSLEALNEQLKSLQLNLTLRMGDPLQVLKQILSEGMVKSIYWNRCYEPEAIKRDALIKAEMKKEGVDCQSFNANLLYEPWTIQNKQGKPFQVFTPFYKHCLSSKEPETPFSFPSKTQIPSQKIASASLDDFKLLPNIAWDKDIRRTWKPGADEAKKTLRHFLAKSILSYKENRDLAFADSVSHLSPYLHWGEISPRMIWHETLRMHDSQEPGVEAFLRQLMWREFAYHLLYHFPKTPQNPLRGEFGRFPWKNNLEQLRLWQKGKTGYPFVDAGMRQLWNIGWMHNRLRLVVGSFLVKDLLIAWEEGAKWFWDTLLDADLANNTLGWQWVSGCGADAAPYFRIFNPVTQGEKFDPEGEFVKKWVPELARLPKEWIHRPWEAPEAVLKMAGITLGEHYPLPIVDHAKARIEALNAFDKIKEVSTN